MNNMYSVSYKLLIEAETPEEACKHFWPTVEAGECDKDCLEAVEYCGHANG